MTKDEARELFIDYMYGGLDIDTQKELETFLLANPDVQEELESLQATRALLSFLPEQQPKEQFVMMEPEVESPGFFQQLKQSLTALKPKSGFGRLGFATVGFVFLFVITGALTDMNLSVNEGNFSLSFGEQTPAPVGYTAAQVELIINQVQAENAALVADIVEAAQIQQESQIQETLASFASYIEEQRTSDLQLIDYSLTNLEETTYNRFVQTDQVLGEIIETVSLNR